MLTGTGTLTSTHLAAVAILGALVGAGAVGVMTLPAASDTPLMGVRAAQLATGVRAYDLDIVAADLAMGGGATWHAWTFDGQVPGPLLTVTAGQTLRVTVNNRHDLAHSFHTHLADYGLDHDGSQVNSITGIGMSAMIPPGQSHTYEFRPLRPGVYYYHCHSSDGDRTISQHMAQGLYGAIVVLAADEPAVREESLFMGERGFDVDGQDAPYYIMNGKGIPGGERTLEVLAAQGGAAAVAAQFGVTVPVFKMTLGETMRLAVVNIGDQLHSFHLHGIDLVSVDQYPGRIHPANVVQLVPGGADRVLVTPQRAGIWLFHCHLVSHADQGMIGVLVVEDPGGGAAAPTPPSGAPAGHGAPAMDAPRAAPPPAADVVLPALAGADGQELRFSPDLLQARAGQVVEVAFRNEGQAPHTFTIPDLGVDTGTVPPGGSKVVRFTARAGAFDYLCAIPGHRAGGMEGRLEAA